ncbi:AMP-binding protein [Croceivirga sp. JEA036]|uniref:AMP-binding protein n=1 Tax=Croceivirga sp. JEA036 TaxID=2721162 RepID=UPI00143C27DB|nr:AMP-binding protein [Croceivirga sp. JEA036]NJB35481.1 AMP-binding protein [Croceivirga sp. JEA036]
MEIHPNFKLDDIAYDAKGLLALAKNYRTSEIDYRRDIGDFLMQWLADSTTIEVQTSGSTGAPKLIRLQKKHMVNSAMATGAYFNLGPNSRTLLCLPAQYIAGKMMLVRALVLGWNISIVSPSLTPLAALEGRFDFVAMIPAQVEQSLKELHRVESVLIGGAAVSESLRKKLVSLPLESYESYGMTETITHIALKKINQDYFTCLPQVSVSKDDRGCLVINAPKVADTPIITNDIVELVYQHKFKWLGRWDNVINSGGVKLIPERIEKKYAEVLSRRFFVAGLPDDTFGNQLVLLMEGNPTMEEEILAKLNSLQSLEKLEYPKKIFFTPQFIETETGKINRGRTLELVFS